MFLHEIISINVEKIRNGRYRSVHDLLQQVRRRLFLAQIKTIHNDLLITKTRNHQCCEIYI